MASIPQPSAKATLRSLPDGDPVKVQFNPATLVYTVENSVVAQSAGPKKKQYVAQFSGKLTMDLQFDTTTTGTDVRLMTNVIAGYMQATGNASAAAQNAAQKTAPPSADGGDSSTPAKAPPVLMFEWGSYQFKGIMDSFKETIDFFSSDGVALRSLVSIGLSRQDLVFDDKDLSKTSDVGSVVKTSPAKSLQTTVTDGGDKHAARQLGADNGLESLRFTGGVSLQVNAGVQLNPPAAFVTAPSVSAGAGIGIGAGAGVGIGASAGIGVSAGASAGVQANGLGAAFGATASAGVPATAGAFAGLQTGIATVSSTSRLNPMQMLPATIGTDVSTAAGSFSLGGAANAAGPSGLSTDVGMQFSFSDRLTFSSDD